LVAIAKAKKEAAQDAEAEREESMRDQLQIENEKKTKPYFIIDKYNRQVPPDREPQYFGAFARVRDSWVPHGPGQMLLDDQVHTDGQYVKGLLWGQGKYVEGNGSVWEGSFYDGQIHGVGFYTENDYTLYPPERRNDSDSDDGEAAARPACLAVDKGDTVATNGGSFSTIGNRLEALMRRGELVCYLLEIEVGVQIELNDAALCVPLGSRATVIKHVKGWKFRCRMQAEANPRERQIDLSTTKNFRVLRELKMAYDLSSFASASNSKVNLKMDETRQYDYVKDTYQLPAIRQISSFPSSMSTFQSSVSSGAAPHGSTSMASGSESTIDPSGSAKAGSRQGKKVSKDEQLEIDKGERAKLFLATRQGIGPNLGIAGSRPTAEMRYLNTAALTAEQRKSSDYTEQMFEARALGIGKTLAADLDEAERARKRAEWTAILNRRREEEKAEKQRMVAEQQAIAVAEASKANAEKRKAAAADEAAAAAVIEASRLEWEQKTAEEEAKNKRRDEERAEAKRKLKSR
jgi:hypothetical protein